MGKKGFIISHKELDSRMVERLSESGLDLIGIHPGGGEKANELLHTNLFRPPHGAMRLPQYFWLGRKYRIVMWDLVTRDYSKWMTAEDVVNNVRKYVRNGSIITFHDSLKSIEKLRTALPESIKWLKEQGYEFRIFD